MDTVTPDISSGNDATYRQVFRGSPLPMWVYDIQSLRMLAVNSAALTLYGYSRPVFLTLSLADLHPTEEAARLHEHLKLPLIERVSQRAWRHRHRNGELMDVEIVTQDMALNGVQARLVMVRDLTRRLRAEQQEREIVQHMTTVLESMSDAFFTLDPIWRFTYVNAQAEKVLRRRRDELLGFNVWEIYPAAVGSVYQIEYQRAMTELCTVSFEAPDADGLNTWLSVTAYPSSEGLAVYFHDISEKHQAELALQEEQRTLAAVINATADAVVSIDSQGRIKMFNPGAERIFQYSREDLQGKSLDLLLPANVRAVHAHYIRSFVESGTAVRKLGFGRRVKGLRSDGQALELEVTISRVDMDGEPLLIACLRDVTERVALDAQMQRSQDQLAELTRRLMAQERTLVRGLAQTLHDHLGQTMAAIRMAHETILTLQNEQGGVVSPVIIRMQGQISVLIGNAISQVRQVLMELRPPLLEDQGLAVAIDNELRNRSLTQPYIDITFDVAPEAARTRWPADVEYGAFMVAREAVENALRHSGSPSVSVRLSGSADLLQLEVVDNGEGITSVPGKQTRHLGILGMHERAQTIGAKVTVDSTEGRGTRVDFNWQRAP